MVVHAIHEDIVCSLVIVKSVERVGRKRAILSFLTGQENAG